jgi:hypothetical protein
MSHVYRHLTLVKRATSAEPGGWPDVAEPTIHTLIALALESVNKHIREICMPPLFARVVLTLWLWKQLHPDASQTELRFQAESIYRAEKKLLEEAGLL